MEEKEKLLDRDGWNLNSDSDSDFQKSPKEGCPDEWQEYAQAPLLPTKGGAGVTVYRILKTMGLFYVWIILGLCNTIVNSTLLSLGLRTGSDMEELGRAIATKFAGRMVGSVSGGAVSDRMRNRTDLIIAVALALAAVTVTLNPQISCLRLLELNFFLEGFAHGCLNAASNSMCLMVWGSSASSPLHAMHFGLGIGMTFAPLIAGPFLPNRYLSSSIPVHNSTTNSLSLNVSSNLSRSTLIPHDTSTIEYPYLIIGVLTMLASIVFYAFSCVRPPRGFTLHGVTKTSFKEVVHPSSCGSHATFTVQLLIIFCMFYFFLVGHELSLRPYLFSYAVKGDLHLSNHQAAYLDASNNFAFMCGRGVSIVAAYFCKIQILLFVEVFLLALFSVCLVILGFKGEIFLWVLSCAVSVASAPIYPGGLAWADRYIAVSAIVVSLVDVLGGVSGMCAAWLTGDIFEYYTPQSPFYVALAASLGLCVMLVAMQIVGSMHGERHHHDTMKGDEYVKLTDANKE